MIQPIHVAHNCYLAHNAGRHTSTLPEYGDVTGGGFHPECTSYKAQKYFIDCREPSFVGTPNVASVCEYWLDYCIKDMEHYFRWEITQATVTNISGTQPQKYVLTMGNVVTCNLMMIILWAIDISFQSPELKWASWTHTTPCIEMTMIGNL